jgi:hypothetical protein
MPKRWKWRVGHVPKGVSYAVQNSQRFTRILHRLGIRWVDKDCHITKDGEWVFGHWGLIAKNGFILPKWFRAKYGRRPKIKQVTWADLDRLQSEWITFRGRRRYQFVKAEDGMRLIAQLDMGLMAEQKGDDAFGLLTFWQEADALRARAGLVKSRFVVATLPKMANARRCMQAAHGAAHQTMVIRAQDGVPRSWAPFLTWYRGRIRWIS